MFRSYAYWVLFLSSYAPLFGVLAIRSWGNWPVFSGLLSLTAFSVVSLWYFVKAARDLNPEIHQVVRVKNHSSEVMIYIASYILPFFFFSLHSRRDVIALVVLFMIVGSIYIRSDLVYVNPTLNLFQYGMYEIHNSAGQELMLISKHRPPIGLIRAHPFGKEVLLGE